MLSKRMSFCMVQISNPICMDISLERMGSISVLATYRAHRLKVGRGLVLKVVRVGDLPRSPNTFVGRIVNVRCRPFALVRWVLLHWRFPLSAARDFFALGIGDSRRDPIAIFLIIPILRLLSLRIRNACRFVIEPVIWFCSFLVDNLEWRILIPVLWLGSLGIRNPSLVNPVIRLLVFRIVDLGCWIDCGSEIFQ